MSRKIQESVQARVGAQEDLNVNREDALSSMDGFNQEFNSCLQVCCDAMW